MDDSTNILIISYLIRNLIVVFTRRVSACGMLRRVAFVKTDVSEERTASIIRMTGIGELGTTLAVTSNRSKL
jgi:hypothetical protein